MPTQSAPAGRRRFWIVVGCFALVNIAAWLVYVRCFAWRQSGVLRVESFEPGDGAVTGPRPTLRWRFNVDVIPPADYGHDAGTVTPAVAGHWAWDDPRTLCFIPDADLPRASRISFTLSDNFLRGIDGGTLAHAYTSSIISSPLKVLGVQQAASEPMDRFVLAVRFNDRVNPVDVLQHLTVRSPAGKVVHCEVFGQASGRIVRIQTDSIPQADNGSQCNLGVRISAGLGGAGGPMGMMEDYSTTLALERGLMAMELTAESPAQDSPHLNLTFDNSVDLEALKQVLSISPAIPFTLQCDDDEVEIDGQFRADTRYTVQIAAAPAGSDAAKYPLAGHLSAFVPDRQSGVWFDADQGYLSTGGNRAVVVHAVNIPAIRVSVTRVYDDNLVAWRNYGSKYDWDDLGNFSLPVAERTIHLPSQKNIPQNVRLALDDLLPASARRDGVYRISVTPANESDDDDDDAASAVVTLSDIGLTAKQTRDGVVAWAVSLRHATPMANVRIRVYSDKSQLLGQGITDGDGLAHIQNIHPNKDETVAVILADRLPAAGPVVLGPPSPAAKTAVAPSDLTWLDVRNTAWEMGDSDTGGRAYLRKGYEAYVYTERGVYRPGETVHLRAILRGPDNVAPSACFPVQWQLLRPDLHDWKGQVTMLDSDGAAALDVSLPADLPTGVWTAEIALPGQSEHREDQFGSATFQVEDFIPSRMKVALKFPPQMRFAIGHGPLKAAVQADYLFGRPAAGLPVSLTMRIQPAGFSPAGWDDWTFGDTAQVISPDSLGCLRAMVRSSATLDGGGHYDWAIDAGGALGIPASPQSNQYMGPWKLSAASGVSETGGRTITAARQIELDLLPAYIAVRRAGSSDQAMPGEPCEFQIKMVRPDGFVSEASDEILQASLQRENWNTSLIYTRGNYSYQSTRVLDPIAHGAVQLSAGAATWSVVIPDSGSYVISLRDPKTNAMTTMEFDASDGTPWNDNVSRDQPEHLVVRVLSPDQPNDPSPRFGVGEKANVLIASPFPGRLLLTVETDDVVQSKVIAMPATHIVVPITVTGACRPNAFVCATVISAIDPNARWNAHRAFGVARLNVDPSDRALNVALIGPASLRPMQSLDLRIAVTDSSGRPAADAAVTVAAVDEGICQLTDFATPDPLAFFTGQRALSVESCDLYDQLMSEAPRLSGATATGGDASPDMSRHGTPVIARRVKSVSLAWLQVRTDADGMARASFPIPEFEGRLRVMAVAYKASQFGSTDKAVTVASPVLVQSSWPRFAAPGDQFTVPLVVFNNTSEPAMATISAQLLVDRATPPGILQFGLNRAAQFTFAPLSLRASGQRELDLPVFVGSAAGVARIRIHMAAGADSYDDTLELPIRPAAPMTQFGGYAIATTTRPAIIADFVPMLPGTGSVAIGVTSWPTLRLPQALDYLNRYPYGCVEQTTSAAFPLLVLGDLGKQIDPTLFDANLVRQKINRAIVELIGMQTADGGLAMWPGDRADWDWGSIYAAHFLVEARAAGFDVPDDFFDSLLSYVGRQLDRGTDDAEQLETQSYAAYILTLAGKSDRGILSRLTELASSNPPDQSLDDNAMRGDARLMLACAWLLDGRRDLAENLLPDSLPLPRIHRETGGNIGSPIRDRALLIYTLATVRPDDPALPNLVQQLADAGAHGQWDSTQDNAFALLAIARYLQHCPRPAAYQEARLLAPGGQLSTSQNAGAIAWRSPSPAAEYSVRISGAPTSAAFVSWLQTGVPLVMPRDVEHGLAIYRRYLDVDGHELKNNIVRSGDLVKVELTIEAPPDESNLVIDDLLPAGLEIENPRLSTSAQEDEDTSQIPDLARVRVDMRDDRLILMADMPGAATARYEYLARAVTRGTFIIPPVRIEAMYDIATNALSGGGGRLIVQPMESNFASAN
ncbi:MAG TPA: MG2 domain-containing protein [Tepidisphaeraceae bacterium]|nr:MG2 domain-containing protein [Tepidisphaeraceae bacterium]